MSSDPRRVLYVRVDGCFGGPERHILTLLKHIDRSRFEPVVAPMVSEGGLAESARELGVPVAFVPMPTRLSVPSARKVLTEIIQEYGIDLVHTYGIRSNLVAGPLAKRHKLPWVARVPNLNYTDYGNRLIGWFFHFLNNRLLRQADAVQVISTPLRDYFASLGNPPERLELIPNGIDLPTPPSSELRDDSRQYYGIDDAQIVIGSLGRVEQIKGYDQLLYCIPHLPADTVVLIGGEGSESATLMQEARVLDVANRFKLVGFVQDIRFFLAACDLYVQPSYSEGVPSAMLEGMAMSLPVVATKVGGIEDVIRDEEDGILVPPGDRSALLKQLTMLCEDREKRVFLGERARGRVEEVGSAEKMTRRIETLYDSLLSDRQNT